MALRWSWSSQALFSKPKTTMWSSPSPFTPTHFLGQFYGGEFLVLFATALVVALLAFVVAHAAADCFEIDWKFLLVLESSSHGHRIGLLSELPGLTTRPGGLRREDLSARESAIVGVFVTKMTTFSFLVEICMKYCGSELFLGIKRSTTGNVKGKLCG